MRIYIAGKVTGEDYGSTKLKFERAEQFISKMELDQPVVTINPIRVVGSENVDWKKAMSKCLAELPFCHAMFMLNDWQESHGAKIEHAVALAMRMKVFYEDKL